MVRISFCALNCKQFPTYCKRKSILDRSKDVIIKVPEDFVHAVLIVSNETGEM